MAACQKTKGRKMFIVIYCCKIVAFNVRSVAQKSLFISALSIALTVADERYTV